MKGITPIVAVVLLISITVIAAVGMYYWVGGLTNKPKTPEQPALISAEVINTQAYGKTVKGLLLQNVGTTTFYYPSDSKLRSDKGLICYLSFNKENSKDEWRELKPGQGTTCYISNNELPSKNSLDTVAVNNPTEFTGVVTFYGGNMAPIKVYINGNVSHLSWESSGGTGGSGLGHP